MERKDAFGTIVGTSAKAPYGYGECRACKHKNVHRAASGYLATHGSIEYRGTCPGSGTAPVRR